MYDTHSALHRYFSADMRKLKGYTKKPAHPVAQKDDPQNQQDRIHYTLVTAALVAFIWWLNFYNLLG